MHSVKKVASVAIVLFVDLLPDVFVGNLESQEATLTGRTAFGGARDGFAFSCAEALALALSLSPVFV